MKIEFRKPKLGHNIVAFSLLYSVFTVYCVPVVLYYTVYYISCIIDYRHTRALSGTACSGTHLGASFRFYDAVPCPCFWRDIFSLKVFSAHAPDDDVGHRACSVAVG
jgi:hypothetical protein